jgi:hydroxymethylpyrimidine/phosphomethylpyrimidine kinase
VADGLRIPRALTIAGSDSSGGAGIQADLKTFSALGVYGLTAITAITAQNTAEVKDCLELPSSLIKAQIEAVVEDIGVNSAKTGMLSSIDIVETVVETLKKYDFPLVVDPVMTAKSGANLLKPEAVKVLKEKLIPASTIVTPNRFEAETLTSMEITGINDARRAAETIVEELGAKAALVKGGHISGEEIVDVLYVNGKFFEFKGLRIKTKNLHGTGCSFSAAIAAWLAKGENLPQAAKKAREFITFAIKYGLPLGKGYGPVNPTAWLSLPAEKFQILDELSKAVNLIESKGEIFHSLTPEVQMNLVYALPKPYAQTIQDVAAIPGRIVKFKGKVKASGPPEFGASNHLAKAVLKIMDYKSEFRSAICLKYDSRLIEAAKRIGLKVSFYDRREEPEKVKKVEGATVPWGIEKAVRRLSGETPDVIYHLGDIGKEAIINVFGRNPVEVVDKALKMALEANLPSRHK